MVWHERGKYGAHHGRTLRSPAKKWGSGTGVYSKGEIGYVSKVVTDVDRNLSDEELKQCLDDFAFPDGFDSRSVAKESLLRKDEILFRFGSGYESDNVLLSLKKRKRWLIPELLKEKLAEDGDDAVDYLDEKIARPRVVLIERKGSTEVGVNKMVKRGDCVHVLDTDNKNMLSQTKIPKLSHVGDLYEASHGTEIVYEVSRTVAPNVWPNNREYKDQSNWTRGISFGSNSKSKLKTKGIRNKRRFWGPYRTKELKQEVTYMSSEELSIKDGCHDDDIIDIEELEEESVSEGGFELGSYIAKVLSKSVKKDAAYMRYSSFISGRDSNCRITHNSRSSETVKCHGKGSAIFVEKDKDCSTGMGLREDISEKPSVKDSPQLPQNQNKCQSKQFNIFVSKKSTEPEQLKLYFGDGYKEGQCTTRKFSITPVSCREQYLVCEPHVDQHETRNEDCISMTVTHICDKVTDDVDTEHLLQGKSHQTISDIVKCFEACSNMDENKKFNTESKAPSLRKTVVSFDVLNEVHGHTTRTVTVPMACSDIQSQQGVKSLLPHTTANLMHTNIEQEVHCAVCYDESTSSAEGFTALIACCHWFCNDCWYVYLTVEMQLGKTSILCPAHGCNIPVDNTTFMALAPDSFLKYTNLQRQKALETSSEWKWCPGNKCNLVAMVSCSRSKPAGDEASSALKSGNGSANDVPSSGLTQVPVTCVCGQTWCFECQSEPHWPATCKLAEKFRQQTKAYQEILNAKDDRIRSVFVKHCPVCHYPVEKNGGCPHMNCTMCSGQFCWECLSVWDTHNYASCGKSEKSMEEVELTAEIGSARYNRNLRVAVAHRQARNVSLMFKMYKNVDDVTNAVSFHHKNTSKGFRTTSKKPLSSPLKFFQMYSHYSVAETLKIIVDFKFLSHCVIEGTATLMAMSRSRNGHRQLQKNIQSLKFIISRLEDYVENKSNKLCSDKAGYNVECLLQAGRQCMVDIGKAAQMAK